MNTILSSTLNVLSAARIWKNLPLLFIFLSGMVIGDVPLQVSNIIWALAAIALASAFMTHLNIITDRELDLIKKPHLYKMLSSDKRVMRAALVTEILIPVAGMAILAVSGAACSAACILSFFLITVLYSYNFFSRAPQKNRFKVFWHGHFLVLTVGYLSLWYAGYYLSGNSRDGLAWLPAFLGISFSEYGLFLFESSVDQKEEQTHKLNTLAAKLGTRKTTAVAFGIALAGLVLVLAAPRERMLPVDPYLVFLPTSLFILVFLSAATLKRAADSEKIFKVPDVIFNLGRIYILFSCIYLKYIAL